MRHVTAPLPQYVLIAWCLIKQEIRLRAWYLVKHRDNFTFTSKTAE